MKAKTTDFYSLFHLSDYAGTQSMELAQNSNPLYMCSDRLTIYLYIFTLQSVSGYGMLCKDLIEFTICVYVY